jgi:hypothetical protein
MDASNDVDVTTPSDAASEATSEANAVPIDAASDATLDQTSPSIDAALDVMTPTDAASDVSDETFAAVDSGPPLGTSEATSFAIDPAHDNMQPNDVVASPLVPRWTAQLGGAASFPIVTGGLAIVAATGTQSNVVALDLATGQVAWGPIVFGQSVMIAYDAGSVFALSDATVTALRAVDGSQGWTVTLTGQLDFWSPPVAVGGYVYVNGLESGGTTYAVDETTGATTWTANTFDGSDGCVAVSGGVVYEAEACDQLSAFNALTGQLDWYHSGGCTGGGGAAPAVYMGLIWERDWAMGDVIIDSAGTTVGTFAASVVPSFHAGTVFYVNGGMMTAVDVATNTLKWTFAGDATLCTSAVIAGGSGQVFVGSSSGNLYEVNEVTGVEISSARVAVTCGSETQSIGLASNRLLVPSGDSLVAY